LLAARKARLTHNSREGWPHKPICSFEGHFWDAMTDEQKDATGITALYLGGKEGKELVGTG
jgi:hypothetical protein